LKGSKNVGKFNVILVNLRNLWHVIEIKLLFSFELKPFLLEAVHRFLHAKFNKEIFDEFIASFFSTSVDNTEFLIDILF